MPQVTATKAHRYGSKQHAVGDSYEIGGEHLRLYTALGWVSAGTPAPVRAATPAEAATAPAAPFKRGPGRPRKDAVGTYSRRDLVAETPTSAQTPRGAAPVTPTDEAE